MKNLTIYLFGALMLLGSTGLLAQTDSTAADTVKYWSYKGNTALNLSQVALVNWAAGGENSIGVNLGFNFASKYEKNKFTWQTDSKLAYGTQKVGQLKFRKSDDLIDITSTFQLKAAKHWKYTFLQNLRTQFAPGYTYPDESDTSKVLVSKIMSPGTVTLSLGMEYTAPKYFTLLLSPITSKSVIVLDTANVDQTAYGIDADKRLFQNLGAYMKANFEAEVFKNVTLKTQLELFSNYLKNPQNVDIRWTTQIIMKVNSWLNVTVSTELLYDDDQKIPKEENGVIVYHKGTQFRENLAVGITYNFKHE